MLLSINKSIINTLKNLPTFFILLKKAGIYMEKGKILKKLLGRRVKELRIKKGLSQDDLSEIIGREETSVSKLERGINFVKSDTVASLSEALDVTPQDLFNFEHHKDIEEIKKEIMKALEGDEENIRLFYRIFKFFK